MKIQILNQYNKPIYIILSIIVTFMFFSSCSDFSDTGGGDKDNIDYPDGNDSGKEPVPLSINIIGKTITNGSPLSNVKVSAAGKFNQSDTFGNFAIEGLNTLSTETDIIILAQKDRFAPLYKKMELSSDATTYFQFHLLPFSFTQEIENLDVEIKDKEDKFIIDLNQNSLSQFTKFPITISGLEGSKDINTFPGTYKGFSIGEDFKKKEYFLKRTAFFYFTLEDNQGYSIHKLDNNVTIKSILPDSFQDQGSNADTYKQGDKIDLWKFEPSLCKWVLSDTQGEIVTHLNRLYVRAQIDSTGWWSACEKIEESQKILIKTQDLDKNPILGLRTYVETQDKRFITQYSSTQPPSSTTEPGVAYIDIPKDSKLNIAVLTGNIPNWFPEQVDTKGYPDIFAIGTFTIKKSRSISGSIKMAQDNSLLKDIKIYTSTGDSTISDQDGKYSILLPDIDDNDLEIFITGRYSQLISNQTQTKDILINNLAPQIKSIHVSPSDKTAQDSLINLKAQGFDPENGSLTYSWATDYGSFENLDNNQAVWRSPSSGDGTANITIEVTDDKGEKTATETKLFWEQKTTTNSLRIIVKDFDNHSLLEGIDVIRHIDNSNFKHLKTDENGIADFGDISSAISYFTIFYDQIKSKEYDDEGNQTKVDKTHILETVKRADSGEITYYIKQDISLDLCNNLPDKSINFSWNEEINPEAGLILFSPFKSSYIPLEDYVNPTLFKACDFLLEDNDSFSILPQLVLIDIHTAMPYVKAYDIIKNIDKETSIIDSTINKNPLVSTWYNSNEIPSVISAKGIRKEVEYQLITNYINPSFSTSGHIYFPNEEFFDSYLVTLYDSDSLNSRIVTKRYDSFKLEPSISFEFGDIFYSNNYYRLKSDKFEWEVSGNTDLDYQTINIFPNLDSEYDFQWKIYMDDFVNEWSRPNLPEIITNVLPSSFENTKNFVTGAAFSDYAGFSDIFEDMQKGIIPSENTKIIQITTTKPILDKDN